MSIVRIGMAEDNKFGDGYDAIFGKKTTGTTDKAEKKATPKKAAKTATARKKPAARKPAKKK